MIPPSALSIRLSEIGIYPSELSIPLLQFLLQLCFSLLLSFFFPQNLLFVLGISSAALRILLCSQDFLCCPQDSPLSSGFPLLSSGFPLLSSGFSSVLRISSPVLRILLYPQDFLFCPQDFLSCHQDSPLSS
jgi:hypothetical protein